MFFDHSHVSFRVLWAVAKFPWKIFAGVFCGLVRWPKSTVAQKCHGNFNLLTAISICSRQFQFAHGSFNFAHGNFNLLTAVSICSRQFQFAHGSFNFAHGSFNFTHGNFNLLTAVSIRSRQFQFHSRQFQFAHGSFNLLTAVSISLTAVSICLRQFQFRSRQFQFRSWWGYSGFQLTLATPVVKFYGKFWSTLRSC